jgi:hypothetical protein
MLHVDRAIVKYLDLMPVDKIAGIRSDAVDLLHDDAKKVLTKISGKRPGKKCKGSYISADKKCGDHLAETASGKRKLSEAGKKSAMELAAKVRKRKGLGDKAATKKDEPVAPNSGLATLTGTEKQIEFATNLLGKLSAQSDRWIAKRKAAVEKRAKTEAEKKEGMTELWEEVRDLRIVKSIESAGVVIDYLKKSPLDAEIVANPSMRTKMEMNRNGSIPEPLRQKGWTEKDAEFKKMVSAHGLQAFTPDYAKA